MSFPFGKVFSKGYKTSYRNLSFSEDGCGTPRTLLDFHSNLAKFDETSTSGKTSFV